MFRSKSLATFGVAAVIGLTMGPAVVAFQVTQPEVRGGVGSSGDDLFHPADGLTFGGPDLSRKSVIVDNVLDQHAIP